jgi:hypothetical protein
MKFTGSQSDVCEVVLDLIGAAERSPNSVVARRAIHNGKALLGAIGYGYGSWAKLEREELPMYPTSQVAGGVR